MNEKTAAEMPAIKPALAEIFSAMSGIGYAGVALSREGYDTKKHPLTILGFGAANRSYDARYKIANSKQDKAKTQEDVAISCLKFLETARPYLARYPLVVLSGISGKKGGTVLDLEKHIESLLVREALAPDPRPLTDFSRDSGSTRKPFHASYLPEYFKEAAKIKEAPASTAPPRKTPLRAKTNGTNAAKRQPALT